MVIGANPAENHPISFRWIMKAMDKGAKLISVDPRYTRTSSKANIYGQLRSGTDIAFIGGMINYALQNNLIHKEYVAKYTNASFLVNDDYKFDEGLFSGFDAAAQKYDMTKWGFKRDADGKILRDETLQNPRTVYQLMKQHYSRYTIDKVTGITGTSKEVYEQICKTYCATSEVGKSGSILYAMGGTQHTVGSQNVRIFAVLQMLLGNIGIAGGGVNALRGESNVQGSTDFGLLYHNMTGYLDVPYAKPEHADLKSFLADVTPKSGYFVNKPKFFVSLFKAMYGKNATSDNEFGYHNFPKAVKKDYSYMRIFEAVMKKEIKGMMLFGTNPIVGGPNSNQEQAALKNLDWMVAIDLWETETAAFWQKEAGSNPADINTEVFFLPACGSYEKEGSISNSGRWMQYRWKAIEPKGQSKADLEILHMLAKRIKKAYENEQTPQAKIIQALTWDFGDHDHPDIDKVCMEINGRDLSTGKLLATFANLKDDGTTACGNWIYSGFYPEEGKNRSKSRDNKDTGMSNFLNWSYAWPLNRRVLYNRAAADYNGKPWSDNKKGIWWDEASGTWVGNDVPDFGKKTAPYAEGGTSPFIMTTDGVGNLYANMKDGPLPEHYEPFESPVTNALSKINLNPVVKVPVPEMSPRGDASKFPIVATTYRMSEHWQSGSMTRNQPWLSELVPHMFAEISEELAKEKGINNKDKIIISSARGSIEVYALVTKRFKPYNVNGKQVHHIGMPWNFGFKGIATGASANRLTPYVGDPSSVIPEFKAFLCDIRRA